jgi:hypothetical protein
MLYSFIEEAPEEDLGQARTAALTTAKYANKGN